MEVVVAAVLIILSFALFELSCYTNMLGLFYLGILSAVVALSIVIKFNIEKYESSDIDKQIQQVDMEMRYGSSDKFPELICKKDSLLKIKNN